MLDTSDVIYEDLTATGTTLYDLVKTRVWWLESDEGWENDSAAIVYHESSETTHDNATDVITSTFVFLCYGGSDDPADAKEVYRALCDRLNGARARAATSGHTLTANLITGSPYPDPDKGWPCWQCSFEVTTT
jgi:hypothetical protein